MKSFLDRLRDEFGGWKHLNARNVARKVNSYVSSRLCLWSAGIHRRLFIKTPVRLVRWGSDFGGWHVPLEYLPPGALCYCAGVGEDTTFDEKLLEAGCTVYAFDPTPRAVKHVERRSAILGSHFHFVPVGIWSSEKMLRLTIHADPNVESCSILPIITNGEYIDVPCKSVPQIMAEFGHATPDLLKLDIEGAEYEALKSILDKAILPKILMIDFDLPVSPARIHGAVQQLRQRGYSLVAIELLNYTFVRLADCPGVTKAA